MQRLEERGVGGDWRGMMVYFCLQPHAALPPSPSSRHRVVSPDKAAQAVQALPGKAVQVVGSTYRSGIRTVPMAKAESEEEACASGEVRGKGRRAGCVSGVRPGRRLGGICITRSATPLSKHMHTATHAHPNAPSYIPGNDNDSDAESEEEEPLSPAELRMNEAMGQLEDISLDMRVLQVLGRGGGRAGGGQGGCRGA